MSVRNRTTNVGEDVSYTDNNNIDKCSFQHEMSQERE